MTHRLLLWLISFFPVALMVGTILFGRWRKLRGAQLHNEIIAVVLVFAALLGIGTWRLIIKETQETHVFIQDIRILLLAIPSCVFMLWLQNRSLSGISRGRMWFAFLLRSAMVILVALALAGLQMIVERDALTVLFAMDISKSIPDSERARALDFMRKSKAAMKETDAAGLIVFGGKAAVEMEASPLFEAPQPNQIKAVVDQNSTNIAAALRTGGALFDNNSRKRLVLFTDGRQTSGDALDELKRLATQKVDAWIVPLKNGDTAEMLVEKIVVPNELLWEQAFDAHVFVWSNVKAEAMLHLYPGDKLGQSKISQKVALIPGKNRFLFPGLRMHSGGSKELRAVLEPLHAEDDTLNENNVGYAFTDVKTESRVLVMTSSVEEVQNLLGALEGEKLDIDVRSPTSLPNNPEDYRAYDCIIMANIARGYFSEDHMSVIESCVKDQGAGLIMIGGEQSFGAGGYLHTPIEKALPVNMELENKKVMPSGALCIVLHTCEFADGNSWGKKISKAAINVLSPQDYAGLILYGNIKGEEWCFKPMPVARKAAMFTLIDAAEPGDMPSLEAVVSKAVAELNALKNVSLKHCIIITDADPQPPTPTTLTAAKTGGISISAVAIYPHGGMDVGTLKDCCLKTGGRYYLANDPKKLPQIFIKEAAVVRKSLIHTDDKGIPISLSVAGPTLKEFGNSFPSCKAMVITEHKARAELQLFTVVEGQQVPVLSSWRYGLGQSVAFTTDCTNRWAPNWIGWPSYKKFWTNIIRSTSRQRMPSNHTVTTRLQDGVAHVVVEGFDAKGDYLNFAKLVGNAVAPKGENEGESYILNFTMTQPGRYEATFPVDKAGAYAITVIDQSDSKRPQSIVTGLANGYSPEFAHTENDESLLIKMGETATNPFGKNAANRLKDLSQLKPMECGLFAHDLPPESQPTDLFKWLLLAALCLLPLDVAVRRLALDPERLFLWLYSFIEPALLALNLKRRQLQTAAAEALTNPVAPPNAQDEIVPSGPLSRDAQSRYEQAGSSDAAKQINLDPNSQSTSKPVVGGTKLSQTDNAASDYTSALLKAKKRANKD